MLPRLAGEGQDAAHKVRNTDTKTFSLKVMKGIYKGLENNIKDFITE